MNTILQLTVSAIPLIFLLCIIYDLAIGNTMRVVMATRKACKLLEDFEVVANRKDVAGMVGILNAHRKLKMDDKMQALGNRVMQARITFEVKTAAGIKPRW